MHLYLKNLKIASWCHKQYALKMGIYGISTHTLSLKEQFTVGCISIFSVSPLKAIPSIGHATSHLDIFYSLILLWLPFYGWQYIFDPIVVVFVAVAATYNCLVGCPVIFLCNTPNIYSSRYGSFFCFKRVWMCECMSVLSMFVFSFCLLTLALFSGFDAIYGWLKVHSRASSCFRECVCVFVKNVA